MNALSTVSHIYIIVLFSWELNFLYRLITLTKNRQLFHHLIKNLSEEAPHPQEKSRCVNKTTAQSWSLQYHFQPPTHSISQRISDQASSDDEGKLYSKEMEYDNEYVIRETQEDEINEYEENAKRSKELETSLRDFQETIDRRKSPGTTFMHTTQTTTSGTNLFDDLSFDSEMLIDARVTTQQAPKGTRMLLPMKGQQHFVPFISSNAISSTPLSRAGAISSSTRKERTFQRRKVSRYPHHPSYGGFFFQTHSTHIVQSHNFRMEKR